MPNDSVPVPEVAGIVVGGPLDSSAPEGQPPEGHVVNAPVSSASEPFYKGLSGDIKSADELKAYVKLLEDMHVQQAAQRTNPPVTTTQFSPVAPAPTAPIQGAKDRFSELIFSKPEEAFEVAVQEAMNRTNAARATERQHEQFWNNFYVKNADLGKMKSIVTSIVSQRGAEISALQTEAQCEEFIARESRKVIDLVRKESGFTETKVASGGAVMLGGSGETVPRAPVAPAAPLNFAEQIKRLKPVGKARA